MVKSLKCCEIKKMLKDLFGNNLKSIELLFITDIEQMYNEDNFVYYGSFNKDVTAQYNGSLNIDKSQTSDSFVDVLLGSVDKSLQFTGYRIELINPFVSSTNPFYGLTAVYDGCSNNVSPIADIVSQAYYNKNLYPTGLFNNDTVYYKDSDLTILIDSGTYDFTKDGVTQQKTILEGKLTFLYCE